MRGPLSRNMTGCDHNRLLGTTRFRQFHSTKMMQSVYGINSDADASEVLPHSRFFRYRLKLSFGRRARKGEANEAATAH